MNNSKKEIIKTSKFLSLILRHRPELIDVKLDNNGWVDIDKLISQLKDNGKNITKSLLIEVVESNDKKRFTISDDGRKIRAAQGHSIDIDLNLISRTPPECLFHGTSSRFLDVIMKEGLKSMSRKHVHLSEDPKTALNVASRHGGNPVILSINSKKLHLEGKKFYKSDNGVWLTDFIESKNLFNIFNFDFIDS